MVGRIGKVAMKMGCKEVRNDAHSTDSPAFFYHTCRLGTFVLSTHSTSLAMSYPCLSVRSLLHSLVSAKSQSQTRSSFETRCTRKSCTVVIGPKIHSPSYITGRKTSFTSTVNVVGDSSAVHIASLWFECHHLL